MDCLTDEAFPPPFEWQRQWQTRSTYWPGFYKKLTNVLIHVQSFTDCEWPRYSLSAVKMDVDVVIIEGGKSIGYNEVCH